MEKNIKFSLVTATLGRYDELRLLLTSLTNQTYKNFEVIIVDQNPEGFLNDLIDQYKTALSIMHLRSEKGLSRARNIGIKAARGEIVCFPDDDCLYLENTLERVSRTISDRQSDGALGAMINLDAEVPVPPALEDLKRVNKYSLWFKGMSVGIFIKKEVILKSGLFDEQIGVGSGTPYGSGEESDLLARAIMSGAVIYRDSGILVRHPDPDFTQSSFVEKAAIYGRGRRFVLRKLNYNKLFILLNVLWPLVNLLKKPFNRNLRRYYWGMFLGRAGLKF